MEKVQVTDLVGMNFFPLHDKILKSWGVTLSSTKEKPAMIVWQLIFLLFTFSCLSIEFYSILCAIPVVLKRGEYERVGMNILTLSVCISASQKLYIALSCQQNLINIGKFRKRNTFEGRPEGSAIETIIKYGSMIFYYGTFFLAFVTSAFPAITSLAPEPPLAVFPFTEGINNIIEYPVRIVSSGFMFGIVAFVAISALTSLAFLVAQLQDLEREVLNIEPKNYAYGLRRAVDRHNEIIKLYEDINAFINGVFLFQVIIATCLSALAIFCLQFNTEFMRAFLFNVPLGLCSFIEFSIQCKLGDEVTHQFAALHRAIYKTTWHEIPLKDKTSITIFQEMTKKKMTIHGGKIFAADLHTYVQVLQDIFSFYVLVKTVFYKQ